MNFQAIKYRLKTVEFWTLLSLIAAGVYFLIQALGMPFEMRRTIGPGFIPTLVLLALIGCALLVLIQYLINSTHNIFSNIPEGSEEETTFKALIQALNSQPGATLGISTHTGLGPFSALSVAKRRYPGTTLLAASSRASQMNAELAARLHLDGFKLLSLLYFDPFVLVVRPGTCLKEAKGLGYDNQLEETAFLARFTAHQGKDLPPLTGMETKQLCAAFVSGQLDAIIVARSELIEVALLDDVTLLETFDGKQHTPEASRLVYGDWAALFAPASLSDQQMQEERTRLEQASVSPAFSAQLQHAQAPWNPASGTEASQLLSTLVTQGQKDGTAAPASGRAYAIPITLTAIALFPFMMTSIGFIISSVIVTSIIMMLLRTEFSSQALIKVAIINVIIAVSTYMIFYHIFGIPLPIGLLW